MDSWFKGIFIIHDDKMEPNVHFVKYWLWGGQQFSLTIILKTAIAHDEPLQYPGGKAIPTHSPDP